MSIAEKIEQVPNIIGGKHVYSQARERLAVTNPCTGEVLSEVPLSSAADLDQAVKAAAIAQKEWGKLSLKDRVQVIFRLKTLMEENADALAALICKENGKTLPEAHGELSRAVECAEYATSLPQVAGGIAQEVSRGVECKLNRYPLGVVAAITPFNFPLMVPMWMAPTAIACGNAFILKPSEQTPLSAIELGRMFDEAGLPAGIFSVVNGGREIVEAICDHPGISAIGFVGSTKVAKAVFDRGSLHNKRVKALGGAKNHLIVMPDADPDMTAANVVASATGCAGQRCMAASVLLAVGDVEPILDKIKDKFRAMQAGKEIGSVISPGAKERILSFIDNAEKHGAKLAVDGRKSIAANAPSGGYYVGPSVFDHAKPEHAVSCDEIFGPTLTIIRCKTLDEAIAIENNNPYGNAAAVYTSSGEVANYFTERANSGMIGVNIGVPVPREPFPFGGWNDSSFGQGDLTGAGSYDFWTKTKKITTKWTDKNRSNWMS
ncbi:CoA-acylating methylmalonate-semialdehyde dehydrogenase [soil metagenome]